MINAAPPKDPPALITGGAYYNLEPQSVEQVEQDMLDDHRFENIGIIQLKNLSTHEERERAARALARRDPSISDQVVPVLVIDAEKAIREERRSTIIFTIAGIVTAFFALNALFKGLGIIAAIISGVVAFFFSMGVMYVIGHTLNMGSVSGRAI